VLHLTATDDARSATGSIYSSLTAFY